MDGAESSSLLLLDSPFGSDRLPRQKGTLHAIGLTATERMSTPFEIELTVVSSNGPIDLTKLLYEPVGVTMRRPRGLDRFFHGIVRAVETIGQPQRERRRYRLEVVPRLWFLSQTVDCRIFQQKTTVAIVRELLGEHKITAVDFSIFTSEPVREYTTQFNETDLDFIHRLLQESGYFYFFEHSASEHRMVVTDGNQAFKAMKRPLHRVQYNGDNVDIFNEWRESLRTVHSAVRLQDYDPEKPSMPVLGYYAAKAAAAGASKRDVFRWPAMTFEKQVATDRARFRIQASEAEAALKRGRGSDPNLCPGFRFQLARDPFTGAESVRHVVHSANHTAIDETWLGGTSQASYGCDFTCFVESIVWRDSLSIPRPVMAGVFSAIVLGDGAHEILSDRLARIKVRLLFDHRGQTVAGMAIWARILNEWSGSNWGSQFLPRVGTEVGISFMNGDPDSPVVVGCFYHQENLPTFPYDRHQTRSGFRSHSTPCGGTKEYSEFSFDDLKGQELVFLRAQKDHEVKVKHDQTSSIGRERTVVTECDDHLTSRTGNITVAADAGSVSLTAATSITLRVGGSSITLTPGAIAITSTAITVTAIEGIAVDATGVVSILAGGAVNIEGTAVSIEALDGEVLCIPLPV